MQGRTMSERLTTIFLGHLDLATKWAQQQKSLMVGYLVVTSVETALLTVGLLGVSITFLHKATRGVFNQQRTGIVILQHTC